MRFFFTFIMVLCCANVFAQDHISKVEFSTSSSNVILSSSSKVMSKSVKITIYPKVRDTAFATVELKSYIKNIKVKVPIEKFNEICSAVLAIDLNDLLKYEYNCLDGEYSSIKFANSDSIAVEYNFSCFDSLETDSALSKYMHAMELMLATVGLKPEDFR